jgi:hypothetical protein
MTALPLRLAFRKDQEFAGISPRDAAFALQIGGIEFGMEGGFPAGDGRGREGFAGKGGPGGRNRSLSVGFFLRHGFVSALTGW